MAQPVSVKGLSVKELLAAAFESGASDLHISAGIEPLLRLHGRLERIGTRPLTAEDTLRMAKEVMSEEQFQQFLRKGEYDFSFSLPGVGHFRVNVFRQRRTVAMAFRVLARRIPSIDALQLPPLVKEFAQKQQGLLLVTGPTGSGKSTTLAAIVDYINETQKRHIITLEDPIEYIHQNKMSLIVQREIGVDTLSFANGLRAALRQDPDVILVGEMRDLETIRTAITAAETGHLVMATLHTPDAPQTVDRIIDVFPTEQQRQIRIQLASVLLGVLSQRLVPRLDGTGRVLALEILVNTPAVANLIRQEKIYQIRSVIQTGRQYGMQTLSASLRQLAEAGLIHRDVIREYEMSVGEGESY
ncbi:MAG: type IV pili twitching motility protein PilT [Candidatus Reconcilbacillus cellulovorans]|uniref:Type IV pili twitching motility protein PilT n=1 Tax=Candidatus Reconcilbacillus cellulovorans TaxID=1906605 RepID=A0A2A6E0Z6_9BACL|nr:MAG: type IV pili twitching motility protein PilT [Candidatus Reconcilbacillus cellulovorans]